LSSASFKYKESDAGTPTISASSSGLTSATQVETINELTLSSITDTNAASNTVTEGAPNGTTVGITANSTDPGGETVA
jgi:hypothetical protein